MKCKTDNEWRWIYPPCTSCHRQVLFLSLDTHGYVIWPIYKAEVRNFMYLCRFRLLWWLCCCFFFLIFIGLYSDVCSGSNLISEFIWYLTVRFCVGYREMIMFINRLKDSKYVLFYFRVSCFHSHEVKCFKQYLWYNVLGTIWCVSLSCAPFLPHQLSYIYWWLVASLHMIQI